jgi:hypothetical protein
LVIGLKIDLKIIMPKGKDPNKPRRCSEKKKAQTQDSTLQNHGMASKLNPALSNLMGSSGAARAIASARLVASLPVYGSGRLAMGILTNAPKPDIDRSVSTITNTLGNQFNSFRIDEQSSLACYWQTMEFKLKGDVFRKLKFITNNAMMEFSINPHSLCQYICKQMNITGHQQGPFWTLIKDTVKRMIERQQTTATLGCKRAFIGTYT